MPLESRSFDEVEIQDEGSFGHVGLYAELKRALRAAKPKFLVPATGTRLSWDRATFLNLTFWSAEEGADVLCEGSVAADVIAHIAWHHLAGTFLRRAAGPGAASAAAFFAGESIASAFDLYLVGRMLPNAPDSDFITTQVPILRDVASEAGLPDADFEALLEEVVREPERAFEDLRALLFEASVALHACRDAPQAQVALERWAGRRFEPLLHHYQLSNWILYARAYGASSPAHDAAAAALHSSLRTAPVALDWLQAQWL